MRIVGLSILVLEHDATAAHELRSILEDAGAEVALSFDAAEALERLAMLDFHAAILDGVACEEVCKALGGVPHLFYAKPSTPTPVGATVVTRPAEAMVLLDGLAAVLTRAQSGDGRVIH